MGSPIGGKCFITYGNKRKLLNNWCGGPILWNNKNYKVVLPIWTRKIFKGTVHKIVIVDLEKMTLTTYKDIYMVMKVQYTKQKP